VRFGAGGLIFAPGTRFDYSSTNWVLVAGIVDLFAGRQRLRVGGADARGGHVDELLVRLADDVGGRGAIRRRQRLVDEQVAPVAVLHVEQGVELVDQGPQVLQLDRIDCRRPVGRHLQ
jgi:hypothetical protein